MARVDIVVFPNGGREIFGQVRGENPVASSVILSLVNDKVQEVGAVSSPKKFTGYYEEDDNPVVIEWQDYDENNPIVQIPVENGEADAPDMGLPEGYPEGVRMPDMVSVELAQVPAELREELFPDREMI